MSRLKLFVSHSSRLDDVDQDQLDDDHNWNLLSETCEGLKQLYGDKIEILVDQDEEGLYPSCDWEERLNEWLAECHEAVILFSKRACETSDWVKKEAAILSWRREIGKNLRLIPILLEGQVEISDLEEDIWSILQIQKSECRKATTSADIVQCIEQALGSPDTLSNTFPQTPFEKLAGHISAILSKEASDKNLESIWEDLAESDDKPAWHPNRGEKFAFALTRLMLRDSKECIANCAKVIEQIEPYPEQDRAKELLKIVRALWVDVKAAALFPSSYKQHGILAMSGRYLLHADKYLNTEHYTIDRYKERAWSNSDGINPFTITSSDPDMIKTEIRNRFCMKNIPIPPEVEVLDQIINKSGKPLLACLDATDNNGGVPDNRQLLELSKLTKHYPNLIIILATGDSRPQMSDSLMAITPHLDPIVEYQQMYDETDARKLIDTKYEN